MYHPITLKTLRLYFKLTSTLCSHLAVKSAFKLFHTPHKTPKRNKEEKLLQQAHRLRIKVDEETSLQAYRWGKEEHPLVLFVHGWSGSPISIRPLIKKLLKEGYQVISYDAIRHGNSTGKLSDLCNWADSLKAVINTIGRAECIIAHSLGAGAVTVASNLGLDTNKFIFIAPMNDGKDITDLFGKHLDIPMGIMHKMRQYTWQNNRACLEKYGNDWEDILLSNFNVPTLIIHDEDDQEVSVNHSLLLVKTWTWADLIITSGLGHRKILYDRFVLKKVLEFIQ